MYVLLVFNWREEEEGTELEKVKYKGQVSELALGGEDGIFQWSLGDWSLTWLRERLLGPWKNACWPWSALLDAHKVSVLSSLGSVFTPLPFKSPVFHENYRRISPLCLFSFPQLLVALLKMIETSKGAVLTVWGLSVRQMKQVLEPSRGFLAFPSPGVLFLLEEAAPPSEPIVQLAFSFGIACLKRAAAAAILHGAVQ